jgi:hypothetical protein
MTGECLLLPAKASVRCVATVRPKSGVKPTCRDRSTDAFDPKPTSDRRLFDHLVGAAQHGWRNGKPHRLCGLEVDDKLVFGRRLDWQVGRLLAFKDAVNVAGRESKLVEETRPI